MGKIVIITNHSYMLWRFRKELIIELAKTHEVVLSMPFVGHEEDFAALGLRCIETKMDRRGINPVSELKLLKTYLQILKKEKPDKVITYSIKPNIYAGMVCAYLGISYSANVQGLGTAFQKKGLTQLVTALYKFAFRKVNIVFFENEANAAEFETRHIIAREKRKVLKGAGINLKDYPYRDYPQNPEFHFLYLGRIMKEKGVDELFEAVERLHDEGNMFVMDMVGFFEDEHKEQVKTLQEAGIVRFHGFREEPRPFYAAADCVVLPSYHEGMSNVLLEAAATGRPLITSNIPGCREAVEEKVTGLLAEVKNAESLYEAMKYMMNVPWQERAQMGRMGHRKIEQEFRKEQVVAETIEALRLSGR